MFTSEDPSITVESRPDDGPIARERRSFDPTRRLQPALVDPVYIARAVWNSKILIVAATLLGLGGGVLYAITTPKIYSATTQILMDPRDLKVVANEVTPNGLPSEATLALVESQTSVIMSSNVLSRVIAETGLEDDPEFNGSGRGALLGLLPPAFSAIFADPEGELRDRKAQTIEGLRHALTVGRETKSFVINLSVFSRDPVKSARLANVTAETFLDEQGRVQSEAARRATEALSSRLSELRQRVVETEGEVEAYKSRNSLIGVGGRLVDDDYIVRINDQLAKARGDITALKVKADSMRQASVEDVVSGTLPEELSSEALVRLRQSYSDLAQEAAVLATKLGPRHPQRLASEGALSAARQAIAGELTRIVAAAQTEFARAEETERNLSSQIDALKVKQVETSGSFVKLRELEREVDASRAVYEAFLLRARETSQQESLNTANVRVISDATPPLDPAGVSRKLVVAAGGLLGLIIGIGLAAVVAVLRLSRAAFAKDRVRSSGQKAGEQKTVAALQPTGALLATDMDARVLPAAAAAALRPAVYAHRDEVTGSQGNGDNGSEDLAGNERVPPSLIHAAEATEKPWALSALGGPATGTDRATDAAQATRSEAAAARVALRERVRGLSAVQSDMARDDMSVDRPSAVLTPEVASLKGDIETVKKAIAEMRRQRATRSAAS